MLSNQLDSDDSLFHFSGHEPTTTFNWIPTQHLRLFLSHIFYIQLMNCMSMEIVKEKYRESERERVR